jgi:hypothetical protein
MAPIVRRLADEGHRAMAIELPGRAGSEPTDIKVVAAAIEGAIEETGMPSVVVGHSFAAMALRLVFAEASPPKIVLIGPALSVVEALDFFGARLGLLPWARSGLQRRLEQWDPVLWPMVAGLDPGQMPGAEMLLLHDPDDTETPFTASAELAALRPGTTVQAVPGAGHSGILSDPRTLDALAGFVAAGRLVG